MSFEFNGPLPVSAEAAITGLNADTAAERLACLRFLSAEINAGRLAMTPAGTDVNNHIHTTWSFSPYSPTKAVWMSCMAGLATAGIMDHDSVGGAAEFEEAGRILRLVTTVGVEMRADMSRTPLAGRRINNPDQKSVAYVALHGIPVQSRERVAAFLRPFGLKRNERNRKMIERLNALTAPAGLLLDFDRDVVPLSRWEEGGSVTERHLLFALSLKMIDRFGTSPALVDFLKTGLKLSVNAKAEAQLTDAANPHAAYDLLGLLKGALVEHFYVDATEECPDVRDVVKLAEETGAICAYAYLGDVTDSVTGDKKSQTFEDEYLDELFVTLKDLGFHAVTYMPSRNTGAQMERIRTLCAQHDLFQISGEDINSPRQKFICEAMRSPEHQPLIDAAWALIGHEHAAKAGLAKGMFSAETKTALPELTKRVKAFEAIGKSLA